MPALTFSKKQCFFCHNSLNFHYKLTALLSREGKVCALKTYNPHTAMPAALSLHIGLNSFDPGHYGEPGTLAGCENDARAMTKLAKSRGFTPITASPLLTKKGTAANVMAGIKTAAATLKTGDTFFITYAGHGSQTPDTNGDEDEGMDETWCLYDRMLVDDELAALWATFKAGVRIIMLSDSCHSGSVSRAGGRGASAMMRAVTGKRYRFFPTVKALRVYRRHADAYDAIQKGTRAARDVKIKASVLLISGCQDNQLSSDGDANGLFTETLLDVWDGGAFKGSYSRFRDKIASWMPPNQQPRYSLIGAANSAFEREQPFTATPAKK